MNGPIRMRGEGLAKVFNRRTIFSGISFSISAGATLLITGRNGSGKSTLVKIISNVLTPSAGTVTMDEGGHLLEGHWPDHVGMVSPYLQVFEEFSALENLHIAAGVRGLTFEPERAEALLARVSLFPRRNDPVRTFSSGMKQRVKYAFAMLHRPPVLILDEPMSNLDAEGTGIVRQIMEEQNREGLLIVATNDLTDIGHFDVRIDLNDARAK
ncbi:MAG: ABC transporter ATP-binding protein [Bacteroidota bacterium]